MSGTDETITVTDAEYTRGPHGGWLERRVADGPWFPAAREVHDLLERLAAARAEVEQVAADRDEARATLDALTTVRLKELHYEEDSPLRARLASEVFPHFAAATAAAFFAGRGVNVVEWTMANPPGLPGRWFTVTVQRQGGKTPMALRAEAIAERDEARAEREGWRDAHRRACEARDAAEARWTREATDAAEQRARAWCAEATAAEQRARAERAEAEAAAYNAQLSQIEHICSVTGRNAPALAQACAYERVYDVCAGRAALAGGRGEAPSDG